MCLASGFCLGVNHYKYSATAVHERPDEMALISLDCGNADAYNAFY